MEQSDQVYIELQKHLDSQAVGFPATKTGVEIRVLKHIFTPEEAEIASLLSYKFEPVNIIFSRVEHLAESPEQLESRGRANRSPHPRCSSQCLDSRRRHRGDAKARQGLRRSIATRLRHDLVGRQSAKGCQSPH